MSLGFLITNLINQDYRDFLGNLVFFSQGSEDDSSVLIIGIMVILLMATYGYIVIATLFNFKLSATYRGLVWYLLIGSQALVTINYAQYVFSEHKYGGLIFLLFSIVTVLMLYKEIDSGGGIFSASDEGYNVSRAKILACSIVVLAVFFFHYIDYYSYDLFGMFTHDIFRFLEPLLGFENYNSFINYVDSLSGYVYGGYWSIPILAAQSVWTALESARRGIFGERTVIRN